MASYGSTDVDKYEETWSNDPERVLLDKENDESIRIVLIGRTGSGKSATINAMMKQKMTDALSSGSSVTSTCQKYEMDANGKKIIMVDTPGFFDTTLPMETVKSEIVKCFAMLSPGPHVILYVLRIGRLTSEEVDAVKDFLQLFGGDPLRYTIVVLTGKDDLDWNNTTTEEFLQNVPKFFEEFLQHCSRRVVFLDNRMADSQKADRQVGEVFDMINFVIQRNAEARYYSNKISKAINKFDEKLFVEALQGNITKTMLFSLGLIGMTSYVVGWPALLMPLGIGGCLLIGQRAKRSSQEADISEVMDALNRDFASKCSIS